MSIKCLLGMHTWNDFTTCAKCAKTRSVSSAVPNLLLGNTLWLMACHGLKFLDANRPALLLYGSFSEPSEDKRRGMVEVLGCQMGPKWTDMVKGDEGDYARLAASKDPEAIAVLIVALLSTTNMQNVVRIAIALSERGGDRLMDVLGVVSPDLRDEKTRAQFARELSDCGIDVIRDVLRIVPSVIRDAESRARLEQCLGQGAVVSTDGGKGRPDGATLIYQGGRGISMNIVQFEVFGRASKPSGSTAGQVCKTWVSQHPGVNPYNARVAVNVDNSGIWSGGDVRQHYGLLHYSGQACSWDFVAVDGQKYLLLVVSDTPLA